ncbi:MAG TPA: ammonium transporter [Rectinemataceae bacterium]|nr:ammonium transporter [Rectinemataceae bacterium]
MATVSSVARERVRIFPSRKRGLVIVALALVMMVFSSAPIFAQETSAAASAAASAASVDAVALSVKNTTTAINIMWMLLCGFIVFFMQAGFALVETGFTRTKNVAHTMMMNMMVFCVGAVGYWLVGFAFQFGSVNEAYPAVVTVGAAAGEWAHSPITLGDWGSLLSTSLLKIGQWGFLGGSGFLLVGLGGNTGILAYFLFQMVFMDTAATIPTGAMAERLKFSGFVIMGLWVSMVVYPIAGNWIWGGGWLQNLGRIAGLGNGAVDFAGSGVVHMIGGSVALAGAIVIGPRIGRFNADGSANALPGHDIPLGILGTIILFFGWFGFNPGSSLSFVGSGGFLAANAAVNTLVAGAVGGCVAMFFMWWFGPSKRPDPSMSVNGILAGLVAITASCAFVDSLGATIIGAVAGLLVCLVSFALEKLHIDDPVGAIPVHFANGMWGVLATGLFANGNLASEGWNGVTGTVRGLFYGNGGQFLAQFAEAFSIFVFVFGLSLVFFKVLNALKLLRSNPRDEIQGLDVPEMGSLGYNTVDISMHGARLTPQMPHILGRKN